MLRPMTNSFRTVGSIKPGSTSNRRLSALFRWAGSPLCLLPRPIQRMTVAHILNHALRPQLAAGDLDFLDQRTVKISLDDLKVCWMITLVHGEFVVLAHDPCPDVSITGQASDFLLLATRRCDPDTLFFSRRLRITGDTELGLAVKNTLDSVDESELPWPMQLAISAGGRVIDGLSKTVGAID
jgi:predicted lipid carrier protein YhbT